MEIKNCWGSKKWRREDQWNEKIIKNVRKNDESKKDKKESKRKPIKVKVC